MKINTDSHVIEGIRSVRSPNVDERPAGTVADLIVIHSISLPPKQYGGPGVEQLFTNQLDCEAHDFYRTLRGLRVSAHLFIRRDGETVQFVPFDKRAWHAGESKHQGRENCNDFSIGIELEGHDEDPYEEIQYRQLGQVVHALLDAYPALDAGRMVGHSDIAPGRKTDPGKFFDWGFLSRENLG